MIKLVSIDVDDTLFMTEDVTFAIENAVAAELGFPPQARETHLRTFGIPMREVIPMRFPGIEVDAFHSLMKVRMKEYIARGHLDALTPQNLVTLEKIKKLGKRIAILTSRDRGEVEHLIDPAHVLAGFVEGFYHRDNTDYLKPDPRVFGPILKRFNVSPQEAVYIGDTPNDGKCAKGAGMQFIALLESGLKTKADFADVEVDYFAHSFPDILTYVESN